ncbi:hypothetical protein MNBD_ALPHA12-516 [hydrothermal vent metagenome]|uniref:Uncharacterized protein n=1 Tax=hydrothermal vent metagenome TaxID=652676 RepID=A0A3B0TFH2_9ZZZZ
MVSPHSELVELRTTKAQSEARHLIPRIQFVMLGQPFGVRTKPPIIHL